MKITKGLKYRIYPNKQQRIMIGKTLGCSRFVYSHFLHVRMDEWSYNHNSLSYESTIPQRHKHHLILIIPQFPIDSSQKLCYNLTWIIRIQGL